MTATSPRVLVVCTANQCRSPLGAAILEAALVAHGVSVMVESAGTDAVGAPATQGTVVAARRIGLDLSGHVATRLDRRAVEAADLVVTMERRHIQDAVVIDARAFAKTYTLKELVRRATAIGPRLDDESLDQWIVRLGANRRSVDVLGRSDADDVADPTASRLIDHDDLAAELRDLVDRFVALAWP